VIRSGDGTTDPIQIKKGVLQGESASPNLFNIFIDGIVDELYSAPMLTGIKLHARIIHILLFADDMVLVAPTAATLQRKINIAKRFFKRRGLKVNLSKTKIVVFRKSGRIHKDDVFFFGNRRIDCVKEYTYLGAPFFSNGSFKLTAEHFKDRGLAVQGRVLNILNYAKSYDVTLSCKLFETMVRSTSLYAAEVWGFDQSDTLEKVQQSFFKRSLALPRNTPNYFLRLETGRLHTRYTVFKSMYRFWIKILGSSDGSLLMDSYMHLRSLEPSPTTSNWCSSFYSTLELLGSTDVWYSNNFALAKAKEGEIMHKLRLALRTEDLVSCMNSSTMPHYHNLKNPETLIEPYLKQRLPRYLASCMAQVRLGYPTLCNKGQWHKLGSWNGDPCRFCGLPESLLHLLEECAGYDCPRKKYLGEISSSCNVLDLLQGPNWIHVLRNVYFFLCDVLSTRPQP